MSASIPKTKIGAKTAVVTRDTLDALFGPVPRSERVVNVAYAAALTAGIFLFYAMCTSAAGASAASISRLLVMYLIVYALLSAVRYPWHAPFAIMAAVIFPIALDVLVRMLAHGYGPWLVKPIAMAIALPALTVAAVVALSWRAEGPRRELYTIARKRYLPMKLCQLAGAFLILAMLALSATVFACAYRSSAAAVIAGIVDLFSGLLPQEGYSTVSSMIGASGLRV